MKTTYHANSSNYSNKTIATANKLLNALSINVVDTAFNDYSNAKSEMTEGLICSMLVAIEDGDMTEANSIVKLLK